MKRKRYTEPQIVFALQQAEGGTAVAEICRKMGVAEQACSSDPRPSLMTPAGEQLQPGHLSGIQYIARYMDNIWLCRLVRSQQAE